jgi:biopolymer transport protein ExbD
MAEVNTEGKGGEGKQKKKSTRVDFTPMVDLGFLLITFFMLTTSMLKPQTMEIAMPSKDKPVDETEIDKVKASTAITVLLSGDDRVFYYWGLPEDDPELVETDFSPTGIRSMLLNRNIDVVRKIIDLKKEREDKMIPDSTYKRLASKAKADKAAPVVMIKADDYSTYKNLVEILDEMQICNIGKYAIVDITPFDTLKVFYKKYPDLIDDINK